MTIKFVNDIWPVDTRYPNAWRGERSLVFETRNTLVRFMYFPAKRENDWKRVDTANRFNISPRWAKWFHFHGYRAALRRNIYHLTVGHFCLTVRPQR